MGACGNPMTSCHLFATSPLRRASSANAADAASTLFLYAQSNVRVVAVIWLDSVAKQANKSLWEFSVCHALQKGDEIIPYTLCLCQHHELRPGEIGFKWRTEYAPGKNLTCVPGFNSLFNSEFRSVSLVFNRMGDTYCAKNMGMFLRRNARSMSEIV